MSDTDTTTACPRCGKGDRALDHLSRWDDASHICDSCAREEAMFATFTENETLTSIFGGAGLDFTADKSNPFHPWYGVHLWAVPPIPQPEDWKPIPGVHVPEDEDAGDRVAQLTVSQTDDGPEVAFGWNDQLTEREALTTVTFALLHYLYSEDVKAKAEGKPALMTDEEMEWLHQGQKLTLARMKQHNAERDQAEANEPEAEAS